MKRNDDVNKMICAFCCIVLFIIIITMLRGEQPNNRNYKIINYTDNATSYMMCDVETGVMYHVTASGILTPLYNADGTLKLYYGYGDKNDNQNNIKN